MDSVNIKDIIRGTNFRFNKALGQNFVSDKNLLDAIVADSGVCKEDTVVEIGTGAGTLTRALAQKAKKVYSFEVDRNLEPVLELSLKGLDNVEVVFKDILKMSDAEIIDIVGEEFKVVANLPYYITTPLVMRFIESGLNVASITVMVQKEVADRFAAKANTADYSAITLAIQMWGNALVTRGVNRNMFYPAPNVDSAVVRIDRQAGRLDGCDAPIVRKLVKCAFSMRRKTLANNLSVGFDMSKAQAAQILADAGFEPMVRGEALSLDDYIRLSKSLV